MQTLKIIDAEFTIIEGRKALVTRDWFVSPWDWVMLVYEELWDYPWSWRQALLLFVVFCHFPR